MKYVRQINTDFEELLHAFKGIMKFEIDEAKIRTEKRKLFQEVNNIIDKMVLNNTNTKRKEDSEVKK